MRLVFVCQECGVHYLPPEDLRYGDGSAASPLWCGPCQGRMAELGIREPAFAAALALRAARAAAEAAGVSAEEGARPTRMRRPARARSGPGTRTRLR
ncbi:hypothetical protein ACIA8O_26210 [Kitasatospora sp. NPDC051853]|uniref:hypothetical protein n=1 Tax=Kitasatospora sp. NPDC051853 TaxID=3364058 RepID=UPI0037A0D7CD